MNQLQNAINFRIANPCDAPAISELIQAWLPELTLHPKGAGAEQFIQELSAENLFAKLSSDRFTYWCIEHEAHAHSSHHLPQVLLGVIGIRTEHHPQTDQQKTIHLYHLFIHKNVRQQGLGRQAWNFTLHECRKMKCVNITINASRYAKLFYEKCGFQAMSSEIVTHGIAFTPMRYMIRESDCLAQ